MTYPTEPNVNRRPSIDDLSGRLNYVDSRKRCCGPGPASAITRNTDTAMNERPAPTATTSPATTSGSGASTTGSGASTMPNNPNGTTSQKDINQPVPAPRPPVAR